MGAEHSTVALVTGSVRGLGLEVARELARCGARVHVVYRTSGELAAAIEGEFPGRVHRADLLREDEWQRLIASIAARDGGVDRLVHAVGEYATGTLAQLAPSELRRMLASNVESAFLALAATRASLRERRGNAVFFGCAGLEGFRARRSTAAYGAAKSALLALVKSWSVEEAPYGVRVNMVSPGQIPHEHAAADTRDPGQWARIPLGRPGSAEEVARVVAWLGSDAASYVTGANVEVAGGWML